MGNEVRRRIRVAVSPEALKSLMLVDKYLVHTILQKLYRVLRSSLHAYHDPVNGIIHLGGQLLRLADELKHNRMELSPLLLPVNQDTVSLALVLATGLLLKMQGVSG